MSYTEKIVDVSTGEEIIREYTKEEIAEAKSLNDAIQLRAAQEQAEADAKVAEKQAIADRLGLTADELKLLLG